MLWNNQAHAPQLLSLHSRTHVQLLSYHAASTKAHEPRTHALQENPLQQKAHALQQRVAPHSLQLKKAHTQQQRPSTVKTK